MRGDDMIVGGDLSDFGFEPVKAPGTRVAFVRNHHRSPLIRAHRSGTRIRKEIKGYILRLHQKQVVVCTLQDLFAFIPGFQNQGFCDLDFEWLNDGFPHEFTP
jgi:hypothetical protein